MSEGLKLIDLDGFICMEPPNRKIGNGGRMGFLNTDAWLDEDDYHVWCAHDCRGERVITMLPWPQWQTNEKGEVRASLSCDVCENHTMMKINRRLHLDV